MIKRKYVALIKDYKNEHLPDEKVFIFGSSLHDRKFRDVDIGVLEVKNQAGVSLFAEALEDSVLPFLVDIVDFSTVSEDFKEEVFKEKILWL